VGAVARGVAVRGRGAGSAARAAAGDVLIVDALGDAALVKAAVAADATGSLGARGGAVGRHEARIARSAMQRIVLRVDTGVAA
jgi:hypothetical protein